MFKQVILYTIDCIKRFTDRWLSNRVGAQTRTCVVQEGRGTEPWLWGVQGGKTLERWDRHLKLVQQEKYLETTHPDYPAAARILGKIPLISSFVSPLIIHLRLAG
jgi:hypothetical protein